MAARSKVVYIFYLQVVPLIISWSRSIYTKIARGAGFSIVVVPAGRTFSHASITHQSEKQYIRAFFVGYKNISKSINISSLLMPSEPYEVAHQSGEEVIEEEGSSRNNNDRIFGAIA